MAYLDGELSAPEASEMAAHIAQCKSCQSVAADLQGVSRQLATWTIDSSETSSLPSEIAVEIALQESREAKHPRSAWNWGFFGRHPWAVAAFAGIIVIPALWIYSGSRSAYKSQHLANVADSFVPPQPAQMPLVARSASPYEGTPPPAAKPLTPSTQPIIVRTAELTLTASSFDTVRFDLNRILDHFGGHIADLNLSTPNGQGRSFNATLRIPASQLDAALDQLRKLGHVESETQQGEEVTQQSVDLEARLANSRHTEERLTEILLTRTGKLSDVLEVEEKLDEVRGRIEQAEAEQKALNNRVTFATVSLKVSEYYRAPLSSSDSPIGTRLSNAAVGGLRSAFNGMIGLIEGLLTALPSIFLFGLIIFLPAYFLWKKFRHQRL